MVKHGGIDKSLKDMITEMFTLYDDIDLNNENTYEIIKLKNIKLNKKTLIYYIIKNELIENFINIFSPALIKIDYS
jgi:hypothetical protein